MAVRLRGAIWWWPWRRKRKAESQTPAWAAEQTDAHSWVNAPTAYQPLVEWESEIARPYVIRECKDMR